MANIARFNVLDNALDDLMRGFFVRPMNYEPAVPAQLRIDVTEDDKSYSVRAEIPGVKKEDINVSVAAVPAQLRIDVTESDKSYSVRAEIPGVKKEDINVSVDGNQVEISAEVKNEKAIKDGERLLRAERHYGKIQRAFALDQDVDETATQARYADGILELTLPKKASAAARRIAIQ